MRGKTQFQLMRARFARFGKLGLVYGLLIALAIVFVGPFVVLLSTSLKPSSQSISDSPPDLIPRPPVLDYFVNAWTSVPFATFLVNSVLLIVITIPIYLLVSALVAYPLARIQFRGSGVVFILFLSTMFLPIEVMLVPRFLVMSELQLTDTYTAMIVPAILSGLGIFLLRQAFAQIPDEIFEAARVDGASELRIFARIAVPIAKAPMALLAILGFISVWNSFIWPLVVMNSQDKFPLALAIAYLSGVSGTDQRTLAAGTVMSLIPVIAVFFLLQRRIIGNTEGAVKG